MSLLPLIIVSHLVASLWAPPQSEPAGRFRWVRATVTAISASTLTLKLRDSSLTLAITSETVMARQPAGQPPAIGDALQIGSTVEAHYTDRKGDRRAVVLIAGADTTGQLSKRPGQSYRGIVERARRSTLTLRVEGKKRSVVLDKPTRLFGADGKLLASGSKDVAAQMKAGDVVLVTYDEVSSDIPAGDIVITSSSQRALEIRRLAPAATRP